MKRSTKSLSSMLLVLIFILSFFAFTVSAETITITASSREGMLTEYKQIYTQKLSDQESSFVISIKGGVLDEYTISGGALVLQETGESDPYFTPAFVYNDFKNVPANEYIANVMKQTIINISASAQNPGNKIVGITLTFSVEWRESKAETQQVRDWASSWVASNITGKGMNQYDKIKAIHDHIAGTYDYDQSLSVYTAQGMLTGGEGVCQAYSLLAKAMLDAAGIESRLVFEDATATNNKGTEDHMWNMVRLDGKWYHMDVTWDDPIGGNTVRYDYFLKSDTTMGQNHTWNQPNLPAASKDYSTSTPSPSSSSSVSSSSKSSSSSKGGGSSKVASRVGVTSIPSYAATESRSSQLPGEDNDNDTPTTNTDDTQSNGSASQSTLPNGQEAARESSSGGNALRTVWLVLALVFLAASGVSIFILMKRNKDGK